MSLASGTTGKRSRHRWRGVVEDFVDLNLNKHSYECILKHTENLQKKLQRKKNPDEMIRKGVISSLITILGRSDLHLHIILQQTAVKVLAMLCKDCKHTDAYALLVHFKAMPHLLKLLKMQPKNLAPDIIDLIFGIVALGMQDAIQPQKEYIEALLAATVCSNPEVKLTALRLIKDAISDNMPSAQEIRQYIPELNILLSDKIPKVVEATLDIYTVVAIEGSDDVVDAMTSTGCLSLMTNILKRPVADKAFTNSALKAQFLFSNLKNRDHL